MHEVRRFLKHVSVKRRWGPFSDPLDPGRYNSLSHVNAYSNAIKHAHKRTKTALDPDVEVTLNSFLRGYKRKVAQLKLEGRMPLHEGKQAAPFTVYRLLMEKAAFCRTPGTSWPARSMSCR